MVVIGGKAGNKNSNTWEFAYLFHKFVLSALLIARCQKAHGVRDVLEDLQLNVSSFKV